MYIDKPNDEPHPNLIGKFEFVSNFNLVEPELEPELWDIVLEEGT